MLYHGTTLLVFKTKSQEKDDVCFFGGFHNKIKCTQRYVKVLTLEAFPRYDSRLGRISPTISIVENTLRWIPMMLIGRLLNPRGTKWWWCCFLMILFLEWNFPRRWFLKCLKLPILDNPSLFIVEHALPQRGQLSDCDSYGALCNKKVSKSLYNIEIPLDV